MSRAATGSLYQLTRARRARRRRTRASSLASLSEKTIGGVLSTTSPHICRIEPGFSDVFTDPNALLLSAPNSNLHALGTQTIAVAGPLQGSSTRETWRAYRYGPLPA